MAADISSENMCIIFIIVIISIIVFFFIKHVHLK